jgi:ABC-type branched-subunit amino acid transport system ATPase component
MSKPKILMMDEPSLGLAPMVVRTSSRIIKTLNQEGITILLIEQNANAALRAAHYGYVLETGRITLTGNRRGAAWKTSRCAKPTWARRGRRAAAARPRAKASHMNFCEECFAGE